MSPPALSPPDSARTAGELLARHPRLRSSASTSPLRPSSSLVACARMASQSCTSCTIKHLPRLLN
eukprot:972485-Pyramimonas_sp.AAC.1